MTKEKMINVLNREDWDILYKYEKKVKLLAGRSSKEW